MTSDGPVLRPPGVAHTVDVSVIANLNRLSKISVVLVGAQVAQLALEDDGLAPFIALVVLLCTVAVSPSRSARRNRVLLFTGMSALLFQIARERTDTVEFLFGLVILSVLARLLLLATRISSTGLIPDALQRTAGDSMLNWPVSRWGAALGDIVRLVVSATPPPVERAPAAEAAVSAVAPHLRPGGYEADQVDVARGRAVRMILVIVEVVVTPISLLVRAVRAALGFVGQPRRPPLADEALRLDPRPPVLLLRSFEDDGLKIGHDAFEDFLVAKLTALGPVIAIGDPARYVPSLRAARAYPAERPWQEIVTELLRASPLIVVVLGSGQGVLWEIDAIRRLNLWSRCILLVPPRDSATLARRWQSAHEVLPPDLPAEAFDVDRTLLLRFTARGECVHVTAGRRSRGTYDAALALVGVQAPRAI